MKTAVLDVGGGLRGIYAAGVFDACMDEGITFDVCIGVSAGSANIASYLAGQRGRNYTFYTEYTARRQYMSLGNFLSKKGYVDLDYVYGTLSNSDGEYPLDYAALKANPAEFVVVATNAMTGEPKYFNQRDMAQDRYDILKASSSIPFLSPPYSIDGVPYYDGALGDPVPIDKAFAMGCEKIVLILTKPRDMLRTAKKDNILASFIKRKYPLAAEKLSARAEHYNKSVVLAKEYEKAGKVLIIAPDDICGMDTLKRDVAAMKRLYEKGLNDGKRISDYLE